MYYNLTQFSTLQIAESANPAPEGRGMYPSHTISHLIKLNLLINFNIMVLIRILKPFLFFYECARTFAMICMFAYLFYGTDYLSYLAFAAPAAIFPIMALFIWIDTAGFKSYIPLYIAGKSIAIFTMTVWFTVSRISMITGIYTFQEAGEILFISGDLLALAAIIVIFTSLQKSLNKQEAVTEEKQCELFQ
jgi:hypothetical protein